MTLLKRTFRQWWQLPRRASEPPEHRQVTFLELFYDLVYVALVAELSHALSSHISWTGVGNFAFLFLIVWWAWSNGTTYHDIHGNNDIRTRVFTFLQMLSVVAMAIFAHDALGESSVGFALSYAAFQLILTYLWWRTGVHDPNHRPLSFPYAAVFLLNTILFTVSAFVPAPLRFYLWGIAVVLSLLLPLYMFNLGRKNPAAQAEIEYILQVSPSLVERYGLFTIIVLGEVVVGVVGGVTEHHHLNWLIGGTAALGTLVAICLWWVYFDTVSHRLPQPEERMVSAWMYLHLPVTGGIAAIGAAILNIVEYTGELLPVEVRWLLVSAPAVALICIAFLMHTIELPESHLAMNRIGRRVMFICGALMLSLGLTSLNTIPLLGVLIGLLIMPVVVSFFVWIRSLDHAEA